MGKHYLALTTFCLGLLLNGGQVSTGLTEQTTTSSAVASSDVDAVRSRYTLSVLPTDPDKIDDLRALSSRYSNSLQSDGRWLDIQYDNDDPRNGKLLNISTELWF
jgi:hypothetical protein